MDFELVVINHTHWDREWFLTSSYSKQWLQSLFLNLQKIVSQNSKYQFFFDGQTLVLEDLRDTFPDCYKIARNLIQSGNLFIGPYYIQPDWRIPGGESLIRNLEIGTTMAREAGATGGFTAWNVDSFGQISQAPQVHNLLGIKTAFLWRGISELAPFFKWKGEGGSDLFVVDLFAGGYRNFFKVTSDKEIAWRRLKKEVTKLKKYYSQGVIPVFDGYDLDSLPGDSVSYFNQHHQQRLVKNQVKLTDCNPEQFAARMRRTSTNVPVMKSEMLSGKYSSTFPGTLSTRTYLKLYNHDTEAWLYRYAEPLSSWADLFSSKHNQIGPFTDEVKHLLKCQVHDVICGCSIDQVHEHAELRYQQLYEGLKDKTQQALTILGSRLKDGVYAYVPNPSKQHYLWFERQKWFSVDSNGLGIVPVDRVVEDSPLTSRKKLTTWRNSFYDISLTKNGEVLFQKKKLGRFVVVGEKGDTYWDQPEGKARMMTVVNPLKIVSEIDGAVVGEFELEYRDDACVIQAVVQIQMDQTACIRWQVRLQSSGSGFSVRFRSNLNEKVAEVAAGMPFDRVVRPVVDTDLLGKNVGPELKKVINGQRDIHQIHTYPFQDFIEPQLCDDHVSVLAKGLRAYQVKPNGTMDLILRRSVDWLMSLEPLADHVGDAGPKFYVPDGRCQREEVLEFALMLNGTGSDDPAFYPQLQAYLYPPLVFSVTNSQGKLDHDVVLSSEMVISHWVMTQDGLRIRGFNPTEIPVSLSVADLSHSLNKRLIPPKVIQQMSATYEFQKESVGKMAEVEVLNPYMMRVGKDISGPEVEGVTMLQKRLTKLEEELKAIEKQLKLAEGDKKLRWQHKYYTIKRELVEAELSLWWNKLRAKRGKKITRAYIDRFDKDLNELLLQYNQLRIERRKYDYIVAILP